MGRGSALSNLASCYVTVNELPIIQPASMDAFRHHERIGYQAPQGDGGVF